MAESKSKVAPGTPPQEDPEAVEAAAKQQEVHEEGAKKRSASVGTDDYDKAYADYEKKAAKAAEAQAEVSALEAALPQLKIDAEQAKVNELKEQDPEYSDDGRLIGTAGEPVSNPKLYGGNDDPRTLRYVH